MFVAGKSWMGMRGEFFFPLTPHFHSKLHSFALLASPDVSVWSNNLMNELTYINVGISLNATHLVLHIM